MILSRILSWYRNRFIRARFAEIEAQSRGEPELRILEARKRLAQIVAQTRASYPVQSFVRHREAALRDRISASRAAKIEALRQEVAMLRENAA